MNYKLTIDVKLMHEEPKIPIMDTLKRWMKEGKIELLEAAPRRVESAGYAPPLSASIGYRSRFRPGPKPKARGGVNFKEMASVLFPHQDSQRLDIHQINDVAHLVKHHGSKNELFVTHNQKSFIEKGKRERLKEAFGIIAMTPEETVEMLGKIEGWK